MRCKITKTKEIPEAFAVTFLTAPLFPDGGRSMDGVRPLAILAANDDNSGEWSWVTLNSQEKNIIGEAMLSAGVNAEEWWWCELYYAPGQQPCLHMTCDVADLCEGRCSWISEHS